MNLTDYVITFLLIYLTYQTSKSYQQSRYEKVIKEMEKQIAELKKVNNSLSHKQLGDFDKDMTFLIHCINHVMSNFKLYVLKPRDVAGYKIIDDELFETWKEKLVGDIVNQLSPNYKKSLYVYFSEEGLLNYIVEKVNFEMIDMIISMKFSKK